MLNLPAGLNRLADRHSHVVDVVHMLAQHADTGCCPTVTPKGVVSRADDRVNRRATGVTEACQNLRKHPGRRALGVFRVTHCELTDEVSYMIRNLGRAL